MIDDKIKTYEELIKKADKCHFCPFEVYRDNIDGFKKYGIGLEYLVQKNHEFVDSWFDFTVQAADDGKKNSNMCKFVSGRFRCLISFYVFPDKDYLTRLTELFEKLVSDEYFDITCKSYYPQPLDRYPEPNRYVLIVNTRYFHNSRNGVYYGMADEDDDALFIGLLPYLYQHNYKDLYERVFYCIFKIVKANSYMMLMTVVSLFSFTKLNDKEKYDLLFNELSKNKDLMDFLKKHLYDELYDHNQHESDVILQDYNFLRNQYDSKKLIELREVLPLLDLVIDEKD